MTVWASINRPFVAASSATSGAVVTVLGVPSATAWSGQVAAFGLSGASPPDSLVIADSATLAGAPGNEILSVPLDQLSVGQTFAMPDTSAGLTILQIPPACAVRADI